MGAKPKAKSKGKGRVKKKPTGGSHKSSAIKGPKAPKGYAEACGINRGGTKKLDALSEEPAQPLLDVEADDEGLLVFMQTTLCRCKIWLAVFDSNAGE